MHTHARRRTASVSVAALVGIVALPLVLAGVSTAAAGAATGEVGQAEAPDLQEGGEQEGAQEPPEQEEPQEPEEELPEGHMQVADARFVLDDVYTYEGSVNDLFVWAWLPTLSGSVSDNAFVGGQHVNVDASTTIGGDFFVFAQTAAIAGQVEGDLYCFCGTMTIAEGGSVGGRIFATSESMSIDGAVRGPVIGAGGVFRLSGTVERDVRVEVGRLEIGPNARIGGDLRYQSATEGEIDPGAEIVGEVRRIEPAEGEEGEEEEEEAGWFSFWGMIWKLWLYAGSFLAGALLLWVGGDAARRPAASLASQPAQGLGFGFVVAVVFPAAALIAMVLIITLPLGAVGMMLYVVALYVARLVTAHWFGDWMLRRVRDGTEPSAYAALGLGLVVFYILVAIPFLGFLFWIFSMVAGLGGIYLAARRGQDDTPEAAVEPAPVA